MTNRDKRKAREHACLMAYQWDIAELPPEEVSLRYWEENSDKEEVVKAANRLFLETVSRLKEVDGEIAKHLKKGWFVSRLLPMDRAILRVATYEILHGDLSPAEAVINDAVEIAKLYGEDPRSPSFINAVLDGIKRDLS